MTNYTENYRAALSFLVSCFTLLVASYEVLVRARRSTD